MGIILLWIFLILGLILLNIAFKKQPLKNWLLCFLIAAYFVTILGDLVVKYELLSYPVQLFPLFQSSVLYEYLLLPVMCVYYYQRTYRRGVFNWFWMALVYSSFLTAFEVLLERNTDLVHYITWNWFYSLVSQFLLLLFIRWLMWLINDVAGKRESTNGSS
ncbi:CBO0543 family protein [Lentibacillus sp.]|uniref:CBO0543 family protein n=1 Tax=Lentibacillus sp. TaxID=1925746 RepID=UPI002B4B5494|nr:CBO0543 family protein [Lentibacillus sp.]HLS08763.1 CBO0543 family protein [Lentibacillus sp.]